jgi:AcrR family transcriptional regulator
MGITERREREKQEMRDLILSTAASLFVEAGFEKTSIRTIADKIEYSPATIYLYFKDKNELFYAISQKAFATFFEYFQSVPQMEDPMDRLHQLGQTYFKFAFENPGYYDLMFILRAPMDVEETEEHWEMGERSHSVLRDIVADCQRAGYFKDMNPEVLAHMIWSTVHGIVALQIRDRMKLYPENERESLVYQALDLFNRMLEKA